MTDLIPFHFDSHSIRVHVDIHGEPWWVLRDICDALGIGNTGDVANRLNPSYLQTINIQDVTRSIDRIDAVHSEPTSIHGNRGSNLSEHGVDVGVTPQVIPGATAAGDDGHVHWQHELVVPRCLRQRQRRGGVGHRAVSFCTWGSTAYEYPKETDKEKPSAKAQQRA